MSNGATGNERIKKVVADNANNASGIMNYGKNRYLI